MSLNFKVSIDADLGENDSIEDTAKWLAELIDLGRQYLSTVDLDGRGTCSPIERAPITVVPED